MSKVELYTRYPLFSVATYGVVTLLHFVLGGMGIIVGYSFSWVAYVLGGAYVLFAFAQMVVIMPLTVCPHCIYYRRK